MTFVPITLFMFMSLAVATTISNPKVSEETKYHELISVNGNYVSGDGSVVTADDIRKEIDAPQVKDSAVKSAPYLKEVITYYRQNKWSIQSADPVHNYSLVFEKPAK